METLKVGGASFGLVMNSRGLSLHSTPEGPVFFGPFPEGLDCTLCLLTIPTYKRCLETSFEMIWLIAVTYYFISFHNQQLATLQGPSLISLCSELICMPLPPCSIPLKGKNEVSRPH